jgi:2-phosphoglycerate kinase
MMSLSSHQAGWIVLLLGGASGVGKTLVAKQLGQRFGASWFQVDDLRLAFQRSRVTLPKRTQALYFFLETPNVWMHSPESLRDGLIHVGDALTPALEVVVENHVDTIAPVVIEGDGILPSLFACPSVRDRARNGLVRAVFLVEPEEDTMLADIMARGRGTIGQSEAELRTEARAKWLYGQWLANEAHHYGLPVLQPRPWSTLVERIITATSMSNL